MFKSNGGFTLVELIVVIAILGLLAGIGIPAYSKYITSAQGEVNEIKATVNANIDQINEAAEVLGWEELAKLEVEGAEEDDGE